MNERFSDSIFGAGKPYFVGCNYWASHAGTNMWRNWDEASVEADLRALSENGVEVIRAFPLWPDFQPLTAHEKWSSLLREVRMKEEPLPDTPLGRAGVDPVMIERFRKFTHLMEKYGLKLIVGIVTGWMSGRMHKPHAFQGLNVLSDPFAIRWEVRFVRAFVRELRNEPAIVAWDLGNECNCMAVKTSHEMWNWSNAISSAIRLEDSSRPIVSGMHGLKLEDEHNCSVMVADQAETTDVLCTHPYQRFTAHCLIDPVNTLRNAFHAAVETRLYEEVGGAPAFVEEAGSLGPAYSSETVAAHYLGNMLWNTYAHNCRGLLWWCAHEQTRLPQTPYDWVAMERSLGLLRLDRSPKPVMKTLGAFGRMAKNLPLPPHRSDAVCILTEGQDQWGVAYMTFLLAKQAGFDLEFQYSDQPLKKSDFYIMPSVRSDSAVSRHRWQAVLDAVVNGGATLYVSSDGGTLEPFYGDFAGVEVSTIAKAAGPQEMIADNFRFSCRSEFELVLNPLEAEVLARNEAGAPVLTRSKAGKGTVVFCAFGLEASLTEQARAFSGEYWKLYVLVAELAGVRRAVTRTNPMLTLTEHRAEDGSLLVCAVNNTPSELRDTLSAPGLRFEGTLAGTEQTSPEISLPANSGCVLKFL